MRFRQITAAPRVVTFSAAATPAAEIVVQMTASRSVAFGSDGDRGGLPRSAGPIDVQSRATALRVAIPAGMLIAYVSIFQPTTLRALAMLSPGTEWTVTEL
jgi:hypothetical protein